MLANRGCIFSNAKITGVPSPAYRLKIPPKSSATTLLPDKPMEMTIGAIYVLPQVGAIPTVGSIQRRPNIGLAERCAFQWSLRSSRYAVRIARTVPGGARTRAATLPGGLASSQRPGFQYPSITPTAVFSAHFSTFEALEAKEIASGDLGLTETPAQDRVLGEGVSRVPSFAGT